MACNNLRKYNIFLGNNESIKLGLGVKEMKEFSKDLNNSVKNIKICSGL